MKRDKFEYRLHIVGPKNQSGMGLPHSTTLARHLTRNIFRKVLECGSPMPLFCGFSTTAYC
jgi:hypothetical protein